MTGQPLPRPREPVTLTDAGTNLIMGCTGCGVTERVPLEPTPHLAKAIQRFVREHAPRQ